MKKVLQFSTITCIVIALSGCGSDGATSNGGSNGVIEPFQSGDIWNGLVYETVTSPYTGKVWLDRNLGASQVCTAYNDSACYGDYYQWGRNTDGHEKSDSNTTSTQATDIANAGTNFILASGYGYDWAQAADTNGSLRSTQWGSTDGTSVCPVGFRVPTIDELSAETIDQGVAHGSDAFASFLKIPLAGFRNVDGGLFIGTYGGLSSMTVSNVDSTLADYLYFNANTTLVVYQSLRAYARPIRCIEDQ